MKLEATLAVSPQHPTLAHHFPGKPIVPGVVILDHLVHRLAELLNRAIAVTTIKKTRFVRPLLGGQTAAVTYDVEDDRVRFKVAGDAGVIASGEFTYEPHRCDVLSLHERPDPRDVTQ